MQPSPLVNPLATVTQLETSGSQLDGIPTDLEDSIRFAGARLTQAAGILLRLPQEVVAQAIVIFMRFLVGPEGGSLAELDAEVCTYQYFQRHAQSNTNEQISSASLYISAKLSAYPKSARSTINVYTYLRSLPTSFFDPASFQQKRDAASYFVSEGTYERARATLFSTENRILKTLGFNTHVNTPYTLCITYLQALDAFAHTRASDLAKRAIAHLNSALLSPQMLWLTHQPTSLAVAAIYLAAREEQIKMPEVEWWEVFDVEREDLGFLCVGMLSLEGFAKNEKDKWEGRKVPMTVEEVDKEIKRRSADDGV